MRDSSGKRETDMARLAGEQHGVVAHCQLREIGFSKHAISRRIAAGRLHPCYAGVFAVGHSKTSRHGRWMAAVLPAVQPHC